MVLEENRAQRPVTWLRSGASEDSGAHLVKPVCLRALVPRFVTLFCY